MGEFVLFPASALSVSGSKGMFSACISKAPPLYFRYKCSKNEIQLTVYDNFRILIEFILMY